MKLQSSSLYTNHNLVIILDNASIHRTFIVKETIKSVIGNYIFLPPQSPFLNAAERMIAVIKNKMRKVVREQR